jgi:hypothetical protein
MRNSIMIYETIIRDKLQNALVAMSQAEKFTPAGQFVEGVECAHSLGFHVIVYQADLGQLSVSLHRNEPCLKTSA